MVTGCRQCKALQQKWYDRLRVTGFVDIEYGMELAMLMGGADPSKPGVEQAQGFYELAWQVFHQWQSAGRSHRDCRVAELFAAQQGSTGTVRGISQILRQEGLSPYSTPVVQDTLKEIRAQITEIQNNPTDSTNYSPVLHILA